MVVSGEAIRMMNYVANIPMMTDEERKRLAEYMRKMEPNYNTIIERLEKGH